MESTEIVRIYTENQASVDVVWLSMPEWTTMREAVEEWLRRLYGDSEKTPLHDMTMVEELWMCRALLVDVQRCIVRQYRTGKPKEHVVLPINLTLSPNDMSVSLTTDQWRKLLEVQNG